MRGSQSYYDEVFFIEKRMKIIRSIFRLLLIVCAFARDVFPYILLSYLIFFLLENLFVGFVSNNFSLNWVLIAVLISGFLAAFSPDEEKNREENKEVTSSDYFLIAGLGLLGALIIYAKMDASFVERMSTAIVSAGLIAGLGWVVLKGDDKEGEYQEIEPEAAVIRKTAVTRMVSGVKWQDVWRATRRYLRPLVVRRVELPFLYVLFFVLFTAMLIPKNFTMITAIMKSPAAVPAVEPSPEPLFEGEPFFWDDANEFVSIRPSENLAISILNGGGDRGAAASFSAILQEYGFGSVEIGNADRYDYNDAQIRFRADDKAQANIIKQLLRRDYPSILEVPADASASSIMVILGAKTTPEEFR